MQRRKRRAVLKWAGGKAQLLDRILPLLPERIQTYYEPFAGGASVLLELAAERRFERAVLSDKNQDLLAVYQALQQDPERLIQKLEALAAQHSPEHYYDLREKKPRGIFARAARLIYLNKTGYNGLFRVNSRGEFNVPLGRYANPRICDAQRLRETAELLRGVEITCADFQEVAERAGPGDAVYFDPPYVPLSKTANFTAYQADNFSFADHERLRSCFESLAARGVAAVLSNSDTKLTRTLYRGLNLRSVVARRSISRDGARRSTVRELLVSTSSRR